MLKALLNIYPAGGAALALLALRLALGLTLLVQGTLCLDQPGSPEPWHGLLALGGGFLLTIGFLTPIAAILIALCAAVLKMLFVPSCDYDFFGATSSVVFAGAILIALILMGPGSLSVDARVFGRREIIIPPVLLSPRQ